MLFRKPRRGQGVLDALGLQLEDICSGVFCFGATGSGKTSVNRVLMQAILNHYVTCLWGCVKGEEADNAQAIITSSVMRERLVRLAPGGFTFNFVSYELTRPGGNPASLTRLLEKLNKQLKNASSGGASNEEFWASLFFDFMHYAIWVAYLARRNCVTAEHIHDVIATSPSTPDDARSESFQRTECWQMLQEAKANVRNAAEQRALMKAWEFFLLKQTQLGENARGAGLQQCGSVLSSFLISPTYEIVCAEHSSFTPETALNEACCILDFPILTYGQSAMLLQTLITMMVQEAALRRVNPFNICVIVRDEFQYLLADIQHEARVQSVCRQFRLAHVSLAQNIPLVNAASGGDHRAETLTQALLPNYRTKLLLANTCHITNQHFADSFGQSKDQFISVSPGRLEEHDMLGRALGIKPYEFSTSEHLHYRLPPESFLTLRRGGPPHWLIDAYLTMGGHTFSNGLPFKRVTFSQR